MPPASFSDHAASCNPDEFFASCLFCGATGSQEEMKEHLGSRHGLVFQQDWKRYSSLHCRCFAKVECGWGSEIQTIKPKLKKKNGVPLALAVPSQLNNARAHHHELEGASLETVGLEDGVQIRIVDSDQEKAMEEARMVESQVFSDLNLQNEKLGSELFSNGVLEKEKVIDSTQGKVVKSSKKVGRLETQRVLSLNLENEELDREMLYRGILEEQFKSRMVMCEAIVEKKLTINMLYGRALTARGGQLIEEIRNYSGAKVEDNPFTGAEEEIVVLRGASESVVKAEEKLNELLSSAQEISLSFEEKRVLVRGGKGCLMDKLVLIGESEKIKEARVELRGLLRESVQLAKCKAAVEKKLTFERSFTRALTDKGGMLVKDIQNDSGAEVVFIYSPGREVETLLMRGHSKSVGRAEEMLEE